MWAGAATLGAVALAVMFVLPGTVRAIPVLTKANWTAGCNGNPYGTYVWPTPTGTTRWINSTPNVTTGSIAQFVRAASPPASNIQQASYFMVGPSTSGCYTPTTGKTGLVTTYFWNVTVNPYLAVNCTGPGSVATANIYATIASNVHIGTSPWYVKPAHSVINFTIPLKSISCSGGGSIIWAPGPSLYAIPQVFTWTSTASTSYDFYSSLWVNATTTAGENAQSVSTDTTLATLSSVHCPAC
jgi:hypothetical protein